MVDTLTVFSNEDVLVSIKYLMSIFFLYYIISAQFSTGNQLNMILSTKQIVVDVCEGVQHVSEVLKIILRRLAIKNYLMDST